MYKSLKINNKAYFIIVEIPHVNFNESRNIRNYTSNPVDNKFIVITKIHKVPSMSDVTVLNY